MAQRKSEDNVSVNQVLQLVDKLSADQREELYRRLDLKIWGENWRALCNKVDRQTKDMPPLSDEDVVMELKAARDELRDGRAESGN